MQQIIQLRPEDDIASIRAKIETAELSHAVLVVPRRCAALETEAGMRLLRRAADDTAAQIALVAHDEDIRDRAALFGIPSFNSLAQAQRTRWKMQPPTPDAAQNILNPPPPETVTRAAIDPTEWLRRWWGAVTLVIAAVLFLCIATVLFVPAANVRIVPSSVGLSLTTDVLADPATQQVNPLLGAIPARSISHVISGTAQLRTTTTQSLPAARSTGTVVFTNLQSVETDIPPGTVVMTSAGVPIRFTTITTTTIPAGVNTHIEAPIQAVDPGPTGNVKALAINTIEGSLNLEAHVINLKPTTSGSLQSVKVVTADDKQKLQGQLMQQLTQQSASLLQQDLKPGEFVAPDSIVLETDTVSFDHSVDDPADVLNLRISATAYALAVNQSDLELFARTLLQKQVQTGFQLLPNGVVVNPLPGGKYQGAMERLPFKAIGYTTPQIDPAKVARALQGKSINDAKSYLSSAINLAQPPEINVTPIGWFRMPWFSFRIAVFVEPPPIASK